MGKLVTPKVYWTGYTEVNEEEILRYLRDSGNLGFWESISEARSQGISNAEILCSMYAKLCYKSLTLGHNPNLTKIRDIESNIKSTFEVGHGSVFQHVGFNFIAADVSRIFTHELVRHRAGTAFSQNSGRYIRLEEIDLVLDPILDPVKEDIQEVQSYLERKYLEMTQKIGLPEMKDFTRKKKITSALRRIAPNGQANEIGFTLNLTSLRHTIMMRTSRHAEWEARFVFQEIYKILKDKFPTIFHGAKETLVDGMLEITGMVMQPYEVSPQQYLNSCSDEQLEEMLAARKEFRQQTAV
jgi:thymidylate synthase (FAD)